MTQPIIGGIDNGSTGQADFSFYKGPVGVRRRPGAVTIEVAYRGPSDVLTEPVTGTLDGETVEVLSLSKSTIDGRMMVAVVRVVASEAVGA